MKNLTKAILTLIAAGFALTALSTQEAQAAQIHGRLDLAGSVMFDSSALQSVTQVLEWHDIFGMGPDRANVAVVTGSYVGLVSPGDTATMVPWTFTMATPNLWTVSFSGGGGTFTFDLASATIVMQTATFLDIEGVGTVHGTGFDDTTARWAFTVQNAGGGTGDFFSFSANTASVVPDGGSAVALLGIGLGVVEFVRRKLRFRA